MPSAISANCDHSHVADRYDFSKGTAERFAAAAPLPATDLVVGDDGALYFTIGGRKTQSGLYRITYTGSESTQAAAGGVQESSDLRSVRRQLEELHHANATDAVDKAWPYLGHSDRYIRFAARIAIEHRPVVEWQQKALTEVSSADAGITALLALARHGDKTLIEKLGAQLGYIASYYNLTEEQSLAGLRVLQLALIRMDALSEKNRREVAAYLSERYPAASPALNRELCTLLVFLQDETVAGKTVPLMQTASTQEEQMFYALCLRTRQAGWTTETRTAYFKWFLDAAGMAGGNSFGGFLKNIRQEAIQHLSPAEAQALHEVLAQSPTPAEPMIEATSRPLVRAWQVNDLVSDVEAGLKDRDFENGRRMFTITGCYKCHRFGGKGGIVGPDLTGVSRRFNARNLLESLIEPSKVISDQYEATVFVTASGQQVVGRVVNLNNDTLLVSENMLNPGQLTPVKRSEVDETFVSKTSMMPDGLLDSLSRKEVLDLVAWLQAGGDPESPVWLKK